MIREKLAEKCRIMRAEGELRRFTPESDATDLIAIFNEMLDTMELPKVDETYLDSPSYHAYMKAQQDLLKAIKLLLGVKE